MILVFRLSALERVATFIGSVGRKLLKFGMGIGVKCVLITNMPNVRNFFELRVI